MAKKINRIGERNINNQNIEMTIIKYNSTNDIDVKFEDGYVIKNVSYSNFKKGNLKSLYSPSVFNIGYLGSDINIKDERNELLKSYTKWYSMMRRCYSDVALKRNPTYTKSYVCKEWHNYTNFKKWFDTNYYEIENDMIELDKDILNKNNKIYSPDNCIFVPHKINSLFTKSNITRGNLPIGVTYYKKYDCFNAQLSLEESGKRINLNLGYFSTPIEAFQEYKTYKEMYIKIVADEYKEQIPHKLYEAMYEYKVEITD